MIVVKEYAVLYVLSAVFVLSTHISKSVNYGMMNRIDDFFASHVTPYIPFPFIGGFVNTGVSMFVSLYSNALKNGGEAINDVYNLMPSTIRSMYNLSFHYAEVVAVLIVLTLLYVYMFSAISFVTNVYNDDPNRVLYIVVGLLVYIMALLYALFIKIVKEWVDLTEKDNKFVHIVNYVIIGVIALFVMMILNVAYNYRTELKDISKLSMMAKMAASSKLVGLTERSEFAKILSIFKDFSPLIPMVIVQGVLTIVLQGVFAAYQLFVTGGFGIDAQREKTMRIFITHAYLLITVITMVLFK